MQSSNHPLRTYRKRLSLTQEALARLIGTTKPTVSRWESGERMIAADMLPKVVEVTGIPARELRPDLAGIFEQHDFTETPF